MAIGADYTVVSAVVKKTTRNRIHATAEAEGISTSTLLARWIESGADAPLTVTGKRQTVRAVKDELMVSLPMAFVRGTGLRKKDAVTVAYSDNALVIRA